MPRVSRPNPRTDAIELAFADGAHATFALQVHTLHRTEHCVELATGSADRRHQAGGLRRFQGSLGGMQIHAVIGPGNGAHPASRNQHRAAVKPISGFHIQVAEMPGGVVHDEALQSADFAVRGPHLVTRHVPGAAKMRVFLCVHRVFPASRSYGQRERLVSSQKTGQP